MEPHALKNTTRIILAVLGYLLIEGFLVFVLAKETGLPEMLFVVSTAGMLAALIYGDRPPAKRALRIVGAVIASPIIAPVGIIAVLPAAFLSWATTRLFPSALMYEDVAFVIGMLPAPIAFFFISRRFRDRNLEAEVERWLSDRNRYGAVAQRRRSRLKRWLLWLPTVTVLAFPFFWSPFEGTISRPLNLRIGDIPGYRATIPLGWTPVWVYERYGDYVTLLKFRGIRSLVVTQLSVSAMRFYSGPTVLHRGTQELMDSDRENAAEFRVQTLSVTSGKLTCWEDTRKYSAPNYWAATCINDDGSFGARFFGDRTEIQSFYTIVAKAKFRQ